MADPSSGGGGGDSIATFQEEMTKLGGRVRIKSVIGQGSYGTVLKAEEISSGRQFAVKRMHPSILMDRDLSIRVLREVLLLRHFSHPHILSLTHLLVNKEIVTQTEGKSDVMEFLSGEGSLPSVYLTTLLMDTDLRTLLESQQELTNAHVRYLLRQLASGLRAIHKAGVAHRDLTPGNILVNTATCELRIADLGLAREVHEPASAKAGMMTQYVTVRWYRAPEVLVSSTAYGVAVDIWALGCILGELLGSPPLFQGTNTPGQLLKIITVTGTPSTDTLRRLGSSAEIRDYVTRLRHFRCSVPTLAASTFKLHDKAAADLFAALLQFDPAQRLTAAQVLRHPYLTGTSGTAGAAAAEDDDDNETPSISCSSTSDSDSDSSTGDEDILTSDDFDPDAAPVALPPARRGRDGGQPRSGGSGGAKRASAGFGNGLRSGGGRGASNGSFSRVAKFVFDPDRFPTSLSVRTELARLHDEMRGIVVRATARAAVAAAAAAAAIARHARLVACDYTVPVNLRFSQQFAHQHTAPTATKCGTLLPRLFLADTPNMEVCVHLSTSATLHSLHTCVADFLTYELATMRMKAHAALAPAHAAGAAARERRLGSTVRNSFVALSQSMQALSADKAAASALSASATASPQQQHGGGGASTHNTIGNTSSETTPRGTVPAKKPSKISSDDTVDADELQQTPRNPLVVLNEHEEGTAAQQQAAAAAAAAAASLNRSAPERSLSPERHPQPNSLARTHGSTFGGIASRQPTPRGSQHRAPSPGSAPAPSPPCASGGGGGGDPAWGAKKRQRAGDRAPAALDASLLERDDDADATPPPPPPPPPPPRHADAAAEQANPFDDGAPAAGDLDAFYTELRAPRRTDALAQRLRDGFGLKAKHLLQLFGPACLVAAPAPASFKDPRSRERVTLGCSASLRGLVYCVEPAAAAAATMPPHAVAADFPPPGGRVHLVREVLVDSCRVAKPSSKGGGGGGGRSYGGRHLRFVFPELHKAVTVPDKAVRAALAVVASSGVACNAAPPAAGPPPPVPPIAKSVVVCSGGGGGGRAGLQLSSEATAELRQAERRKAMASRDMRVSASHAALDSLMLHLQSSPRNRSGGGGGGGGGPPGDATPTSGTPRARHVRSSSQTVSMAHGTPLGGAASGRLPAGHADPHDLPQLPQPAGFSPTRPLACPATRTPHQRTPSSIVAGPATDVIPADTLLSSLRKTEASLNLGASANGGGGVGPPLDDASNAPLLYTCLLNVRCYVWGRFDPAASRFPGGGGGGGHSRVASFDAPSPAPRLRSPRGAGAGGGAAAASAAQSRRHTVPVIDGIAGVKSAFGATGQQAASAQASAAVAATDSARQLNMNDSESDSDSIDFVPATAAAATRAAAGPPTNGKTPNGDAAKKQGHHPPRGVQQQQQAAPTAATATATATAPAGGGGGGGGPPGWGGTGRGAPLQQAAAAGRGAAERPQHNPVAPPPSQQQQPPGAAGRGTPAAGGVGGGGPLARKTSSAVVSKRASGTFAAAAAATAPAQRDPFSIPGDDEAEGGGGSASQRRRRRRSRATTAAGGTDTSQSDVTSVNNSDDSDGDPDGCCRCECVVA